MDGVLSLPQDLLAHPLAREILGRFVLVALLVHFGIEGVKRLCLRGWLARLRFWALPALPFALGGLLGGVAPPVTEGGLLYLSIFYAAGLGCVSGSFSGLVYAVTHRVLSGDPRALAAGRYPKERPARKAGDDGTPR